MCFMSVFLEAETFKAHFEVFGLFETFQTNIQRKLVVAFSLNSSSLKLPHVCGSGTQYTDPVPHSVFVKVFHRFCFHCVVLGDI